MAAERHFVTLLVVIDVNTKFSANILFVKRFFVLSIINTLDTLVDFLRSSSTYVSAVLKHVCVLQNDRV